jgi:murein DD-endopeptidase MepM/ murein hydrolase activator NlpD
MKDGIPENIPNSGQTAVPITIETVGGNNVVIEIAKNRYAFYAHLRPGFNKHLHVGDDVKAGEMIGRVGNTGNTSEPHLHFHIVDGPSFVSANGVPYALDNINAYTKSWSDNKIPINETQGWMQLKNQLVLEDTLVNFPE